MNFINIVIYFNKTQKLRMIRGLNACIIFLSAILRRLLLLELKINTLY